MASLKNNRDVIIYTRLSSEDGIDDMSCSITNQIDLLTEYAIQNEFRIIDIISDDGYSGTNFRRPGFEKMIEMLEDGQANVVLVKDLSRFGRNFIECSKYLDEYFNEMNIRFISTSDNYDSAINTEDESLVIKNFLNGLYAKQSGKRVMDAYRHKAKKQTIAKFGRYGYSKVDGKLVIDEEVAPIVKRIFEEYVRGDRPSDICRRLNEEGVDTPALHYSKRSGGKFINRLEFNEWKNNTLRELLKLRVYCGDTENLLKIKIGKRNNVRNPNPVIIENTHEAIISREIFEQAQVRLSRNKDRKPTDKSNLILEILYTQGGRHLYLSKYKESNPLNGYYYNRVDKLYIRVTETHEVLKRHCYKMIKEVLKDKDGFKNKVINRNVNPNSNKILALLKHKELKINESFETIFEDYVLGELSEDSYEKKKVKLNAELAEIKKQIKELTDLIKSQKEIGKSVDAFIEMVNEETLKLPTHELIKFCIKKVVVIKKDDGKYKFQITDIFE